MKRFLVWLICLSMLFTMPLAVGGEQVTDAVIQGEQSSLPLQSGAEEEISSFSANGEQSSVLTGEEQTPSVESEDTTPTFFVESTHARVGQTVTVAIGVRNNPGIISAKLALSYDGEAVEGISLEGKDFPEVSFSSANANPWIVNFMDSISPNNTTNGTLATVTFKVKETASLGDYALTLSYNPADVFDYHLNPVTFAVENGSLTVIDYIPGDVNGDGAVDNKDLSALLKYLNNWAVDIHENAADVNGDGDVDNMDYCLLLQYLNDWDVTLLPGNYVEPPVETLRVGTYHINALANVNGDAAAIANLIAENNLDVVSLQAVDNNTGRNNNNHHQAKVIAELLGWDWGYTKTIGLDGGEYGHAILSKYPMDSYTSVQLDSAGEENRLLAHGVIDVTGQKINILNSHLSYQGKLSTQIDQVAEYVKGLDNYIIAADFNTEDFQLIGKIGGRMVNNYSNYMHSQPEDGAVDNIVVSPFVPDQGVMVESDCSSHGLVYADVHLNQTVQPVTNLRVGTYNIRYLSKAGGDANVVAQFIKANDLDVVGLQKVDKNVGREGPVQDQAKAIAERLGWYYGYSKAIDLNGGEYGHAILSKYPLESYQTLSLDSEGEEQRVFAHGMIDVGGKKVQVLNVHVSFYGKNATQVTQLKNYVSGLDSYVLTGDFSTSDFVRLAQIDGTMVNNLASPYQTSLEDGAVDNIFVKSYGVSKGVMVESDHSDHHLLYADVNLYPAVQTVNGLRVGTYNIRHLADVGGDATVIANFIKANNLDVVGLQEVDNNVGRDGPKQNQVQAIAEALGWYWSFSKAIDLSGGEYGHGIISKYPMEAYATTALDSTGEEGRAMGHAVLNVNGKKLNVVNVHLSWQTMTGTQINQVANHVSGYGEYIVMGDFNALYDELTPIAGTKVNNATDQFITNVEDGCIDNIIVQGMTVSKGTMVESSYSDHSMLYADVTF